METSESMQVYVVQDVQYCTVLCSGCPVLHTKEPLGRLGWNDATTKTENGCQKKAEMSVLYLVCSISHYDVLSLARDDNDISLYVNEIRPDQSHH